MLSIFQVGANLQKTYIHSKDINQTNQINDFKPYIKQPIQISIQTYQSRN